jgi:hypothetical protein
MVQIPLLIKHTVVAAVEPPDILVMAARRVVENLMAPLDQVVAVAAEVAGAQHLDKLVMAVAVLVY